MLIILIFMLAAYLGGNAYVFHRLMQAASGLPAGARVGLAVAFWLAALSFFAVMALRNARVPYALMHPLYWLGTGWLVFTLYMVMFLLLADALKLCSVQPAHSFAAPLLLTLALLGWGFHRHSHPEVNRVDIALDKMPRAAGRRPMTVVAVSDVHLGHGTGRAALRRYVEMINAERPDLILIAGDLIDSSVVPLYAEGMAAELDRLSAPLGVYMVPGNHEYVSGIGRAEGFLRGTRIRLLRDSVATLPGGLQLVGRDDRSNRRRLPLHRLMAGVDRSRPVILLDHQPHAPAEARDEGVDVQLSGHTHRGQVWPVSWLTDRIFEQSHGYRRWGGTHVYVSSGLSLWGPPFRIGTRGEIAVLRLH